MAAAPGDAVAGAYLAISASAVALMQVQEHARTGAVRYRLPSATLPAHLRRKIPALAGPHVDMQFFWIALPASRLEVSYKLQVTSSVYSSPPWINGFV